MDLTTTDETRAVAATVKRLLTDAGIAQRTASVDLGIPMTTLQRKLKGTQAFTIDDLARVGRLIGGVSVSAIVTHAEAVAP